MALKPLELVIWEDITSHSTEWFDNVDDLNPWLMYTAGWVLYEDENVIKMVSTHSDPKQEQITYGHDTIIPKGAVKERKTIRKRWG